MKGRAIYFTYKELEMIQRIFDYGNISFEGREDEEELWEIAEKIREKLNK
jgi:ArsR family metal-binding transcriptional regulator